MWYPIQLVKRLLEGRTDDFDYANKDGQKALLSSMTYSDPSASPDHYVHITGHRTTVHSTKDKAHKKLTSMGYKPVKE